MRSTLFPLTGGLGQASLLFPSTSMGKAKKDQLLGKLDRLVLRILSTCGDRMHGYAIAERIEQLSENVLEAGEGSQTTDHVEPLKIWSLDIKLVLTLPI